MIEGVVNTAYEAVVNLPVRGPSGRSVNVEAVIDTGFNRFLTLPSSIVTELGLLFVTSGRVTLADGSEASFEVYEATVIWDGQTRDIYAYSTGSTPLVGMLLLDDHDLNIQVRSGGRVAIHALEG